MPSRVGASSKIAALVFSPSHLTRLSIPVFLAASSALMVRHMRIRHASCAINQSLQSPHVQARDWTGPGSACEASRHFHQHSVSA